MSSSQLATTDRHYEHRSSEFVQIIKTERTTTLTKVPTVTPDASASSTAFAELDRSGGSMVMLSRSDSWKQLIATDSNERNILLRHENGNKRNEFDDSIDAETMRLHTPLAIIDDPITTTSSIRSLATATDNRAGIRRSSPPPHRHQISINDRLLLLIDRFRQQFADTECTSRSLLHIIVLIILALLFIFICGLILAQLFTPYSITKLILYPPPCDACLKGNALAVANTPPSTLYVHYAGSDMAEFEIFGNLPLKSNSYMAIDFVTGNIAIADHALTDRYGRHTVCFTMPLDRQAIADSETLFNAVHSGYSEINATYGWDEYWFYVPEEVNANQLPITLTSAVADCANARWYRLQYTAYTKDAWRLCDECYDFCLPDYGIQRLYKYQQVLTLGIRRLNCFRLMIPEWVHFLRDSDATDVGRWNYPRMSNGPGLSTDRHEWRKQYRDNDFYPKQTTIAR